ncbi:MAG: HAMP domain-containing histidine kinase [Clostridia bacterium]|nr:HAMP domain-containing histidine kinase [Clostridia bacterium]
MKRISKNWLRLTFVYNIVFILVALFFYKLVPEILCYPPNSIDNNFQVEINGLTYTQQYFMICLSSIVIENVILIFSLRKVNKLRSRLKTTDSKRATQSYYQLSKYILKIPNVIYFSQVVVPVIMIAFTFSLLNGDLFITLKVCLLFLSILMLIASIAYIFSKKIFQKILEDIFYELSNFTNIDSEFTKYVNRHSIKNFIFMVTLPMFIVTAILIALIGYASVIKETGNLTYDFYNQTLEDISIPTNFSGNPTVLLRSYLENIKLKKEIDSYFMIAPDKNIITSDSKPLSIFFTTYLEDLSSTQPEKNRVYDFYGDDSQGVFRTIVVNDQTWIIGIRYNLVSDMILNGLLSIIIVLFAITIIILTYFANYISHDIERVAKALLDISEKRDFNFEHKLPVISNDELGDLVNAFNKIQLLTKENVEQIKDNQNMLMERERLASLGQLIGGIAHNLKTPIMSIAGAAEGLSDLTKEYETSIGDSEVTIEDHHEISKDMKEWIEKIESYTEYMSDVITAVKGQAVTMADEKAVSFTLDELVKRVDILMKHELKNALVSLNTHMMTDPNISLNGNINSLVQVINNMISNAIQSYNGKTNETIELILNSEDHKVIISIKDYADGLPKEVQQRLFKEMITTKGKNGTGLGLFMSYSTIRAHFSGNITYETEKGKGTTFHIILPISN